MTHFTPRLNLPYPEGGDQVAVHTDLEGLARAVDRETGLQLENLVTRLDAVNVDRINRALAVEFGKNLYNYGTDSVNTFMNQTGEPVSLTGYRLSDYIPVTRGETYTINTVRAVAQYDALQEVVPDTYANLGSNTTHTFQAVTDGFIRFAYDARADQPSQVQVEHGPTVTDYEPYASVLDLTGLHVVGFTPDDSAGGVQVTRDGHDLTVTTSLDGMPCQIRATLAGGNNQVFNFAQTLLAGSPVHVTTDSVAPIRSNQLTIGANHGFLGCATWPAGAHDKTTADIGSLWDHQGETVTLLHVDDTGRAWVGRQPTQSSTGEYVLRSLTLQADLTHVSGATHTAPLVQSAASAAGRQLYPAVKNVHHTITLDGTPVGQETRTGTSLVVRESYEILDLAGIHDAVRTNPGAPFTELPVRSAVLVESEYRFRAGGVCDTWSAITELAPTRLQHCGFFQAEGLQLPVTRYAPGVAPKDGVDWPNGVDLDNYNVSQSITTNDLVHSNAPPVMTLDVGNTVGFALGLHPWKPGASQATRRLENAPTQLWDMRATRKSYPVVTTGEAPGWGRLEAHGIRAYLTPDQAQKIIESGDSAYAAWAALETQTQTV
jgi:hypothetical protein